MNKTVLITGASSGIGLELAKIHASKGDNLIIVARSKAKLEALKKELESKYKVKVDVLIKDLSEENAAQEVFDKTIKAGIVVDYLINNAGFGEHGMFLNTSWEAENKMITLLITTVTQLTKLFLKEMVKRNSGKIMNVSSAAAFQSGPSFAVYAAAKAYVLHFSEAIANEVKSTNVTITTLCPGPTESNFTAVAKMEDTKLFKGRKIPSSKEVAEYGYTSMMKGKIVAVPGVLNRIFAFAVRFMPRKTAGQIVSNFQEKI